MLPIGTKLWSVHLSLMDDQWYEHLRCPNCGKTGKASLSQGDDAPTVLYVPDGFRVIAKQHGPDFQCTTCNVAVML
jgi:hypothetical protein